MFIANSFQTEADEDGPANTYGVASFVVRSKLLK